MLKRLWPFFFPLLFLPNFAGDATTQFGVIEMSDYLIVPYLILLWIAADIRGRNLFDKAMPLILAFLGWVFIGTITINLRYDYQDYHYTLFGLLKLAKFILYGLAGYLTTKCLNDDRDRRRFGAAIVGACIVFGISAIFFGSKSRQSAALGAGEDIVAFKAANAISVYAAMMACYLAGLWARRSVMSRRTRRLTLLAMVLLVLGSAITEGRGGWIAGILGFAYILTRGGLRRQVAALVVAVPLFVLASYYYVPAFRSRVDITLNPVAAAASTTAGIDNGGRLTIWQDSLAQLPSDPLFGTGFFHRGGLTTIYDTGSHNFFLQMFLETGIPGGLLLMLIFRNFWVQAGSSMSKKLGAELPVKALMVSAVAGGMGGEYFYGGIGLLTLLSFYAICGSIPQRISSPALVTPNPADTRYLANTLTR